MALYEPVLEALERHEVRYVVVGGVATVLRGYPRLTLDLDLAIDLDRAGPAIDALVQLGFVPLLPVNPHEFADPEKRREWVDERNLKVFALSDPDDPFRQVDIFAENPLPFEALWAEASEVQFGAISARVASTEHLITMKRMAGRGKDLEDVEALEELQRRGNQDRG
ncbi:MAG: hypothetical protein M3Z84_05510 [Actinomycetota bacterium]|nr:hypothetical protein [Actinomycetota bacterium]